MGTDQILIDYHNYNCVYFNPTRRIDVFSYCMQWWVVDIYISRYSTTEYLTTLLVAIPPRWA